MTASTVQSNAATWTTISGTVTLGATPTAGNTLVAILSSDTTAGAAPTAGSGNSYTQRLAQVDNQGFYVWTRLVTGVESATTTLNLSGAANAAGMVLEVQGTYDKIGAVTSTLNTGTTSRTCTGLSPTTTDNIVYAIAGLHYSGSTPSGGSANNTFTLTRSIFQASAGDGLVTTEKVTGSTAATGTTTVSWTGTSQDLDGIQVAFTGIAAAFRPFHNLQPRRP